MRNSRNLRKQFSDELTDNILNYWVTRVYDPRRKMFYGQIGHDEQADPEAPLGCVMVSRIIWTFAAAWHHFPTVLYRNMADEAWRILESHFHDKQHGGYFWEVKPDGTPVDDSKQFYAQSFVIYALAEYARVFDHSASRAKALELFRLLEKHAFDPVNGGYFEAASRDWQGPARDYITPVGERMKKSMNTHLHVLEAYTNLYRIAPREEIGQRIALLLEIFMRHIINPENHHFHMFFDTDWSVQYTAISYGHDIEGTWLLHEAAVVLGDHALMEKLLPMITAMAAAVGREAIDPSGGLYNEADKGHIDKDFHWWPQAEAVVGFWNAWQLTGEKQFRKWSEEAWKFIRKYQRDGQHGDWHWLITPDLKVKPMDKVSPWKCPYHNGRMCMEMMHRLSES
ncbi:MAG TPA: AGE family epimerase/isomerase [Prolixibacteraceae bacterium]|mgnify:CR=1 FL=1|nr:AGE family epimerase/isomerase [Prolixibacteraceae bacterium]